MNFSGTKMFFDMIFTLNLYSDHRGNKLEKKVFLTLKSMKMIDTLTIDKRRIIKMYVLLKGIL